MEPRDIAGYDENIVLGPEVNIGGYLAKKDLEGNISSQAAALGEVARDILASAGFSLLLDRESFSPSIQPPDRDFVFSGLSAVPNESGGIRRFRDPRAWFYVDVANYGVISSRTALNDGQALLQQVRLHPKSLPRLYLSHQVVENIRSLRDHPNSLQNQILIRELLLDLARYTHNSEKAKEYVRQLKIS
jgi:hypothetical protein